MISTFKRPSINLLGLATALATILATGILTTATSQAQAQNRRSQSLPNSRYYDGFSSYYQGDFDRALKSFRTASSGAFQDSNGRFLDSICFFTMMGECYYQMGSYAEAVEQYEAAIILYSNFKAWPVRTEFPTQILEDSSAATRSRITWGTTARTTLIGNFSNTMNVLLGDPNTVEKARAQGGVIDPVRLRSVDISEVMRCTALAIHRRHVIKGVTCKLDPFTKNMLAQLSVGRTAAGTTSGSWQAVFLGLAQSSSGDYDRAATTLEQSLQIQGFDHPLTPIALLELAYIARYKGDLVNAQKLFLEASYSAAIFNQYDIIADAFHGATVAQMVQNRKQVFAPLEPAAVWAKRENAKFLFASLTGDAIWSTAEADAPGEALKYITQNARALRDGDIANSRVGTRWLYCSALANSMEGNAKNASRDLERFLAAASRSSLWLYQIALADDLVINNRVTERSADLLYSELLRDPTTADWVAQPMETIAYLISPHIDPMLRWHDVNVRLKADVKAIEISDLVRRHRFFSALPLGGRQLSLRWIATAPSDALDLETLKLQTDLLARFPLLKTLGDQSDQLVQQLRQLPVSPEKSTPESTTQKKLLEELAGVEATREVALQALSLRREPCRMSFPPQLNVQQIQERLQDKQLVISVFFDGSQYFISLISKGSYSLESKLQSSDVDRDLANLLKELGLGVQGGTTTVEDLTNDKWREAARTLSATLFPSTQPQMLEAFEEIIVVPDGRLWYFPFELLQLGNAEESVNLFETINVRYAPTLSTTVPDKRQRRRFGKSLVVTGRTHSRDDQDLSSDSFTELKSKINNSETIDKSSKTPSMLLSAFVDQVIVWDEIDAAKYSGLLVPPMSFDSGRDGSSIGAWLNLPWTNVDQLIMPGFESAIGGSKIVDSNGQELFLTSCALLATGNKSLLLSRWPVGGKSTMNLTKEFAAESNRTAPSLALRRSIQLLHESEIDVEIEPRVRKSRLAEPIKGEHPIFWASYMLFDLSAAAPEDPEEPEDDAENKDSEIEATDGAKKNDGLFNWNQGMNGQEFPTEFFCTCEDRLEPSVG